jgi:hypothetical protein
MRIFHAVEHHVQPARGGSIVERGIHLRRSESDDSLMRRAFGGTIKLLAGLDANRDFALAAERDNFIQTRTARAFGNQYTIKRPAGAQRFTDGMDSYKRGHYDKGTS